MTGFNFLSHGSQDLYPTYLTADKLLSSALASKATIIGECKHAISADVDRTDFYFGAPLVFQLTAVLSQEDLSPDTHLSTWVVVLREPIRPFARPSENAG
jgi:hypothetical protein